METYTFDLHRIFFGDLPALFLLEIAFRITVLYVYTLVNLRLLGTRSSGELTPLDLLIVVGLGSAIGDPMFYPKVGLLHGMLTISLVVLIQRAVLYLTARNEEVEGYVKGMPVRIIRDGMLDLDGMRQARLSREEVFMLLRQEGYSQLGELRRVYMEPDGKASVYPFEQHELPRAGLTVLPPWDVDEPVEHRAGERVALHDHYACTNCGHVTALDADSTFAPCPRCGHEAWTHAVYDRAAASGGG